MRYLGWSDYEVLMRDFPRGVLVVKTTEYPIDWTRREVNKSVEGFVSGYGRTDFRPLRVIRCGTVAPIESETNWWRVA